MNTSCERSEVAYYHVRIAVEGQRHDEVKNDIDAETLERQFLEPYRRGEPVVVNGKTLAMGVITRIRVSVSDVPAADLIELLKSEDRNSSVAVLGGPSYAWRAAARAHDVTDQFITTAPGTAGGMMDSEETTSGSLGEPTGGRRRDTVFLICGRDVRAIAAVTDVLRALGLRVVEWGHAVAKTGLPNPYVGDVVQTGLEMADAAVVLITPDDLVRLRDDLVSDGDGIEEREVQGQARPNVYYEAGIADTLGRDRTVIVEIGRVKSFSDAAGRHIVRYDGSAAKRNVLAERLTIAGLDVDTSGEDWLRTGDLEPVLSALSDAMDHSWSRASVDKQELAAASEALLNQLEALRSQAKHDDLSDMPEKSLEFVFRAQAAVDRFAGDSPYAREVEKVRDAPPHMRIPYLAAALRSLNDEARE